ncbi:MAG: NAD(+) synthase [Acutalibacteraceae bacterium]|nr:NAD(+) synthase [Acutalibacteraceae bacterium]
MKHGFIKVGTGCPRVHLADTVANTKEIISLVNKADEKGVKLLCLPELCITGASCGDLFYNSTLQNAAIRAIEEILDETAHTDVTFTVGAPLLFFSKLYNCAVVISHGEILGIVPSSKQSNIFTADNGEVTFVSVLSRTVPFGSNISFTHSTFNNFSFNVAVGNKAKPDGFATIKLNPDASGETVGKADKIKLLTKAATINNICGMLYASASQGESTTNEVFAGHLLIAENGKILNENPPFNSNNLIVSEIDVDMLTHLRSVDKDFFTAEEYIVNFDCDTANTVLTRKVRENPFVPENEEEKEERINTILNIQATGLARRIEHTKAKSVVIGISGGLDSTLALLVCVKAMDMLSRPHTDIIAVTLPCFGTTSRTKSNAVLLCEELGVSFREINITNAVRQHFSDIGHDEGVTDVTYENSQARERTQVLMDIAGKENGFVVGTGDISELALGWATYNGDHMSMYGVNAGVPKTVIRCIVEYLAKRSDKKLGDILLDIVDTPVSPELLPADDKGEIAQKTEETVGPYELHDFFLFYMCRYGFSPEKIYRICVYALSHKYSEETIKKWLKNFMRRFFMSQFKRSCLPDGAKIGSVSLSPRGDLNMPSDALCSLWLNEAENL